MKRYLFINLLTVFFTILLINPVLAMNASKPQMSLVSSPYVEGDSSQTILVAPSSLALDLKTNSVEYVNSMARGIKIDKTVTIQIRDILNKTIVREFIVNQEKEEVVLYTFRTDIPKQTFYVLVANDINSQKCTTQFYLLGKYDNKYVVFADIDALRNAGWSSQYVNVQTIDSQISLIEYNGSYNRSSSGPEVARMQFSWDDAAKWFGIKRL